MSDKPKICQIEFLNKQTRKEINKTTSKEGIMYKNNKKYI